MLYVTLIYVTSELLFDINFSDWRHWTLNVTHFILLWVEFQLTKFQAGKHFGTFHLLCVRCYQHSMGNSSETVVKAQVEECKQYGLVDTDFRPLSKLLNQKDKGCKYETVVSLDTDWVCCTS